MKKYNLEPKSQDSCKNIWFKTKLSKCCSEMLALRILLHIVLNQMILLLSLQNYEPSKYVCESDGRSQLASVFTTSKFALFMMNLNPDSLATEADMKKTMFSMLLSKKVRLSESPELLSYTILLSPHAEVTVGQACGLPCDMVMCSLLLFCFSQLGSVPIVTGSSHW